MDAKPLHILVVDDDEVDIKNIKRAFKQGNITNRMWVANNGIEALEILRGGDMPPERRLILLDLNMPRMNGIELLQALRDDPALCATSVVVLTTSNSDKDKVDAYRLNVAGYLLKPVTFNSFVDVMLALNKYWTLVEMP